MSLQFKIMATGRVHLLKYNTGCMDLWSIPAFQRAMDPSSWDRKIFMLRLYWWKWFEGLWQWWRDPISNKDISLLQWGMGSLVVFAGTTVLAHSYPCRLVAINGANILVLSLLSQVTATHLTGGCRFIFHLLFPIFKWVAVTWLKSSSIRQQ